MYRSYQNERIDVDSPHIFINNTFLYLRPQVLLFDEIFQHNFKSTHWIAFGINDYSRFEPITTFSNQLFMLCLMGSTSNYFRSNFETYTYFDEGLNKMMVKLELPVNNRDAFLEGRYSDLYSEQERNKIFYPTRHVRSIYNPKVLVTSKSWGVLNKLPEQQLIFKQQIKHDFGEEVNITDDHEFDYPPFLNREIFHYDASGIQRANQREYLRM